ncbi:MAG: bacterio-opsin activator [Bacteroidetes bacterium]|jgi:PAS domain S-box-containing protein|nr:bacterio-opsin activator [Bacteroidota bacterium]MDF2453285.1 bacterio-opsin activator [Bacteroidota bacterium]
MIYIETMEKVGSVKQQRELNRKIIPKLGNKDFERFFEFSPDVLCITDFNGRVQRINSSFERLFGYTEKELLTKSFTDFVLQDEQQIILNELSLITNGKGSTNFENRCFSKTGNVIWVSWRTFIIPEEKLIYAIGRDITIKKDDEYLLQHQTECLKEMISDKIEGLQYARLLQEALFHDPQTLNQIFPEAFIFHSSKDIIGGDFYWFTKSENKAFVTCADCTGHGVPGAMLSVLGINKLHEIINSHEFQPSRILDKLNTIIYKALGKKNSPKIMRDGMDAAFYSIDFETNILEYAGANNPLYILRAGDLIELSADKQSIGDDLNLAPFTNQSFQLESGDVIYVFSDGYADQFGGEKGKKFTKKQFKNLLISVSHKSMEDQKRHLQEMIEEWMFGHEQTDDICVIGVKI